MSLILLTAVLLGGFLILRAFYRLIRTIILVCMCCLALLWLPGQIETTPAALFDGGASRSQKQVVEETRDGQTGESVVEPSASPYGLGRDMLSLVYSVDAGEALMSLFFVVLLGALGCMVARRRKDKVNSALAADVHSWRDDEVRESSDRTPDEAAFDRAIQVAEQRAEQNPPAAALRKIEVERERIRLQYGQPE